MFGMLFALLIAGSGMARADELQSGLQLFRDGDYAGAYEVLVPLARDGNAEARFHLGEMHLRGLGVAQNFQTAFDQFLEAAKQGHTQAQVNAGSLLAMGLGQDRDMTAAYFWWIVSATWARNEHQRQAFTALGEVASVLPRQTKGELAQAAKTAWRSGQ